MKLLSKKHIFKKNKELLGGEVIKNIDPECLLKNYSIVFQDVNLFNNTIMENIRIGRKDSTNEEVIEAAKKSKL